MQMKTKAEFFHKGHHMLIWAALMILEIMPLHNHLLILLQIYLS